MIWRLLRQNALAPILIYIMADLYRLNSQSFAAQLRTGFKVKTGSGDAVTLELAEINEPPAPPQVELFSLLFRGPIAPRLSQQTYRFEHDKLGELDLFLTVLGVDEAGTSYEVIFHRLPQKQP
jgi:hypothetical protein